MKIFTRYDEQEYKKMLRSWKLTNIGQEDFRSCSGLEKREEREKNLVKQIHMTNNNIMYIIYK